MKNTGNQGTNYAYLDKRDGGFFVTPKLTEHKNDIFLTEALPTDLAALSGKPLVTHDGKEYGLNINYELYEANKGYLIGGMAVDNPGSKNDVAGYPDGGEISLDKFPEHKVLYARFYEPLKAARDDAKKAAAEAQKTEDK